MIKVTKKTRKYTRRGKENWSVNSDTLEARLMGNALGGVFMEAMSQVANSKRGLGAAASALAMTWATLKEIAICEGVDVEPFFTEEVEYYEGIILSI